MNVRSAAWPARTGEYFQWVLRNLDPHWLLACQLLALVAVLAVAWRRSTSLRLYLPLLFFSLVLMRLPSLACPYDLAVDEAMMLAGAARLQSVDGVFYRSLDGSTLGPLNYVVPWMAAAGSGLPLDYGLARLLCLLLQGATLSLLVLTASGLYSGRIARVGTLPLVFHYLLITDPDGTSYTNELVAVFWLALAGLSLARLYRGAGPAWAWLLGCALGAVPVSKAQGLPQAAVCALCFLVWWWVTRRRPRYLAAWLLGLPVWPGLFWIQAWWAGSASEILDTFVKGAVDYTRILRMPIQDGVLLFEPLTWSLRLRQLRWYLVPESEPIALILAASACGLLVAAGLARRRPLSVPVGPWMFALGQVGAAGFAVAYPGNAYLHYLSLLVLALGWFLPVALATWTAGRSGGWRWPVFASFSLLPILLWLGPRLAGYPLLWHGAEYPRVSISAAAYTALEYADPGESLAIWGWKPQYWIQTGMIAATRDLISERMIEFRYDRDRYRKRYLEQLQAAPPPVFIDSVGPGCAFYVDRQEAAHEAFPELAAWIAREYQLVNDIPDQGRVYVRRDRLSAVPHQTGAGNP